jgi:hypothetical protein
MHLQPGELRCPRCFGKDIVPSMPRGVLDWLMHRTGRIPRHCRFCGKRFYILPTTPRDLAVVPEPSNTRE